MGKTVKYDPEQAYNKYKPKKHSVVRDNQKTGRKENCAWKKDLKKFF